MVSILVAFPKIQIFLSANNILKSSRLPEKPKSICLQRCNLQFARVRVYQTKMDKLNEMVLRTLKDFPSS